MFYNYKVLVVNNEEVLYLYINSMYEFSNELDKTNETNSIFYKIKTYINDMDIKFNGKKVMLVVNGIIIGTLLLVTNDFSNINNKNIDNDYISYKETIDLDTTDNVDVIDINSNISHLKDELYGDNNGYTISNFVKIKNKDGRTTFIDLNNYITSYLSKIIPPTYEEDAIKSAAIVARTEVFRNLYENNFLKEEEYRPSYVLKKMWKKNYNKYFNKLKSAVEDTNYQYLSNNYYFFDFNIRNKYRVPFSSYDANRLAKSGYNYIDILTHYYPDANLISS